MSSAGKDLVRDLLRAIVTAVTPKKGRKAGGRKRGNRTSPTATTEPSFPQGYPGDYEGRVKVVYDPSPDGEPDPGEVVWTWVAYEDDPSQGKDRPVLLIGRDGNNLLGLMLTSQDHTRDAADEARWGRFWMDLGTGAWDSKGRPSEVRLDRILRVDPAAVRREGAILDRERFTRVKDSLIEVKGW